MNKYQILETIGEGEYGVVLKARNKETNQLVAIKKFKEDDSDEENKRIILREVKMLKSMEHPNVIELKEAFRKKGKIYLVCDYVDQNLLQLLGEGPISPAQVKEISHQLLKGLAYMHSLNLIHRDIKPENVLVSRTSLVNRVKLCDFGFARTVPSNGLMTDYVATRWYRPPELLLGRDTYDKSIDVWAAACVIAELIDGEPLFGGQNELDQLYLIQKCLGPLTPQQQEWFHKMPKFVGLKLPEINVLETIQRRYSGKFDPLGLDLLKKMLRLDPASRLTAEQTIEHQYFTKKTGSDSIFELRHSNLLTEGQVHQNRFIAMNNFVQQDKKQDKKSGFAKIPAKTKLKNIQSHRDDEGSAQRNHLKAKSMGKKTGPVTIRDRGSLFGNKPRESRGRPKELRANDSDNDYEDEKWEEYSPPAVDSRSKQKPPKPTKDEMSEELHRGHKQHPPRSKHIGPEPEIADTTDSPLKGDPSSKRIGHGGKNARTSRRANGFSIVFNQNTINLKVGQQFNF